jgi:hypothetical protein
VWAARQFVLSTLADWSVQAQELVALLTSELVTNVIVHTGPHEAADDMVVRVSRTPGGIRVEVTDQHPGVPVVAHRDVDDLSGRGLLLVAALAGAWGVVPAARGIAVWFATRFNPPARKMRPLTPKVLQTATAMTHRRGPCLGPMGPGRTY